MRRRLPVAVAAVALAAVALLLAGCSGDGSGDAVATTGTIATTTAPVAPATTQGRSFVVYAKPTRAQFVDHNDDRKRGDFKNPFDPDLLPTPRNANSGKKGARAGDNALFSFKVYADAKLTRPIGDAIYSCTFNFAEEATCEANFTLTGGTRTYFGALGQVDSTPAAGNTQRFALRVTGLPQ